MLCDVLFESLVIAAALSLQPANCAGLRGREGILCRAPQRRELRVHRRSSVSEVRVGRRMQTRRSPRRVQNAFNGVRVVDALDGDIIRVQFANGDMEDVVIIGIEAPDLPYRGTGGECWAENSWQQLSRFLKGETVSLGKHEGIVGYDRFDRLIRYVFRGGTDVGSWMVGNGYAFAERGYMHRYTDKYFDLEAEAMEEEIGLWIPSCDYREFKDLRLNP